MGSTQGREMASLCDLDTGLRWHLQHNHFPPIPATMIPACKEAVKAGLEEDWERMIELPEGTSHKQHGTSVPANVLIEHAHLMDFIDAN